MYRSLIPEKTVATIETLHKRIVERFPGSSIAGVCAELLIVANESRARAEKIKQPNILVRVFVAAIIFVSLVMLGYTVSLLDLSIKTIHISDLITLSEASINDVVLIGAALFFLFTFETRLKRNRALDALHELRILAHVIDMHQLTKDPSRLTRESSTTESSPSTTLTAFELMRYLDYCSEMLSLTGKIAALYAQDFRDGIVLASVNEIEDLTTGLSRKIWQKIMILNKFESDCVD